MSVTPTAVSWDQFPLTMSMEHMQQLTGRSKLAIYRLVRNHRIVQPMFTRPLQWSRDEVRKRWDGGTFYGVQKRRAS